MKLKIKNIILFLVVIIAIVIVYKKTCQHNLLKLFSKKENNGSYSTLSPMSNENKGDYLKNMHLGARSKCFDCESQINYPNKYKSHSSKCFSCEHDLEKRYGAEYGFFAQPNKCFDCENQMKF